jgi:uncharacterized protein (DUF1697 family)
MTSMKRYALLIRGVNVGTKNSLPMSELRSILAGLGCTDVQTYMQSGNAVFGATLGEAALTKAIEKVLSDYMGRRIVIVLRTLVQLNAIIEKNPFTHIATVPKYLCVTLLSHAPSKSELASICAQTWTPEQVAVAVAAKEIYTWHPNGQGRSPLAAALGKLQLRCAVTTRNWNTVLELQRMLEGSGA